jgi:hypothetical protein
MIPSVVRASSLPRRYLRSWVADLGGYQLSGN